MVAITEEAVGLEEEDVLVEEEAEVTEDLPRRVGVAARVIGTITVEAVEATGITKARAIGGNNLTQRQDDDPLCCHIRPSKDMDESYE